MGNAIKLRVLSAAVLAAIASGCSSEAGPQSVHPARAATVIRYQVDEARGRVWLLTKTGVVMFDVDSPRPIRRVLLPNWTWAGEPRGCPPDLAIGPGGEAVVSSDVLPALWRVDPETFEVSLHDVALDADADKDVGFSRLQYSAAQDAYIGVSGIQGSVWRIDPRLGGAQKIAQAEPRRDGCRPGR